MSKIEHCDCRGSLNRLNDVLAGENGDVWLDALRRFLRKENPWPAAPLVRLVKMSIQADGRTATLQEMLDDAKQYGIQNGAHDFYRKNPGMMPISWKGKRVFFQRRSLTRMATVVSVTCTGTVPAGAGTTAGSATRLVLAISLSSLQVTSDT